MRRGLRRVHAPGPDDLPAARDFHPEAHREDSESALFRPGFTARPAIAFIAPPRGKTGFVSRWRHCRRQMSRKRLFSPVATRRYLKITALAANGRIFIRNRIEPVSFMAQVFFAIPGRGREDSPMPCGCIHAICRRWQFPGKMARPPKHPLDTRVQPARIHTGTATARAHGNQTFASGSTRRIFPLFPREDRIGEPAYP